MFNVKLSQGFKGDLVKWLIQTAYGRVEISTWSPDW